MKVFVTVRLPEEVLADIRSEHEVDAYDRDQPMDRARLLDSVGDLEGLLCTITDRIDDELLDRAPHLKMIANLAVGYDNIDLQAATSRGIPVSNTPGVVTDATADLTFALILASARRVVEGDQRVRAGRFRFFAPFIFLGQEVSGKTLGIIGLGEIGKAVARRARGFDMRVLYHNRRRIPEAREKNLNVEYADMKSLFSKADFVSLHVPLTPETRHLVGPQELALMKPTAFLINASRGAVVDEKALVEALQQRVIAGAGLDVYENEPALAPGLTDPDNVVLLPHVGTATLETRTRMAHMAAQNLLTGLRGRTPPNCLNCGELSS